MKTAVLAAALLASFALAEPIRPLQVYRGRGLAYMNATEDKSYGLMFDMGSSGSRCYIYSWSNRQFLTLPPGVSLPVEDVMSFKTKPGVSDDGGVAKLDGLIADCKNHLNTTLGIRPERFKEFPIIGAATAGMRTLSPARRASVFADVRAKFAASGFMYRPEWVAIIPGEVEGTYGWLASNMNKNTLFNITPAVDKAEMSINTVTWGAIDLGGASTQISFIPPPGSDMMAGAYQVQLAQSSIATIYTHSFLYYGNNQATYRVNEVVLFEYAKANPTATLATAANIVHPCMLVGAPAMSYTSYLVYPGLSVNFIAPTTMNTAECLRVNKAIMLDGTTTVCLNDELPTPADVTSATPATGLAMPLPINTAPTVPSCTINGQYQPPLLANASYGGQDVKLVGLGFLKYMFEELNITGRRSVAEIETAVNAVCNTAYANVKVDPNYCQKGLYVVALLRAWRFPETKALLEAGVMDASFTPGGMLTIANQLRWEYLQSNTTSATGASTTQAQAGEPVVAQSAYTTMQIVAGVGWGVAGILLIGWITYAAMVHMSAAAAKKPGATVEMV